MRNDSQICDSLLIKIGLTALSLFSIAQSVAQAEPFQISTSAINLPKAPGTVGARKLDWSVSPNGAAGYQIPISVPAVPGTSILLNLAFEPNSANGEAGPFWNLEISKISLDLKRAEITGISAANCNDISTKRLLVNGRIFVSSGAGKFVSTGNFASDILYCKNEGFVLYTAAGDIFEYGQTPESRSPKFYGDEAVEWFVTKKASRASLAEVHYEYHKECIDSGKIEKLPYATFQSSPWLQKLKFCTKPLLSKVASSDVTVNLAYESTENASVDFRLGTNEAIAARIQKIEVRKSESTVRSYAFVYEGSEVHSRLIAVKESGTSEQISLPETKFTYNEAEKNLPAKLKIARYNKTSIIEDSFGRGDFSRDIHFVDLLGEGKPALVTLVLKGPEKYPIYRTYDEKTLFPKAGMTTKFVPSKAYQIKVSDELAAKRLILSVDQEAIFADMDGNGAIDIVNWKYSPNQPLIWLNDYSKDEKNNLIFKRFALRNVSRNLRQFSHLFNITNFPLVPPIRGADTAPR